MLIVVAAVGGGTTAPLQSCVRISSRSPPTVELALRWVVGTIVSTPLPSRQLSLPRVAAGMVRSELRW